MEKRVEWQVWTAAQIKQLRLDLSAKRGRSISQEEMARECAVTVFSYGSWERGVRQQPTAYHAIMNLLRLEREVNR